MSGPAESIAIFGATGGCALAVCTRAIEAGYSVNALARKPSKLTDLLAKKGIQQDKINKYLHVTEGNAKDQAAVEKTIQSNGRLVDVIISGLGGSPTLQFNPLSPVSLDDPHICEETTKTLIAALRNVTKQLGVENDPGKKPIVLAISTTGVSNTRDVPIAMMPLYHWLLAVPHKDKHNMEELLEQAAQDPESSKPFQKLPILVRPSLLMDGAGVGLSKIRVGWETRGDDVGKVELGYTITRDDVGAWIFESIVKSSGRTQWCGRKVTLTS